MFDVIRNNKRISQVFLALITLPFAFFGVDSYVRNSDSANAVATVGDSNVSVQEFQAEVREQQDKLRQQLGGRIDPAMFETPAMRRAVLDSIINQRLLSQQANSRRLSVGDADLANFIAMVPALQEGGKFSPDRYAALVASQGMSKEAFEQRLRRDLSIQRLVQPVGDASVAGQVSAAQWSQAQLEQREVSEAKFLPDAYQGKVILAADAINQYYESNRNRFEIPEQVKVEYLTLSQEAILSQIRISDEEIKARYAAKADSYKEAETRRASHILIRAAKDASDSEMKAAQAKAMEILAQVKKSPNDFARLAKENSQDPGSAAKGGDLDWFGRGMMVKSFEESVFSLKEGEISDVVRSDFGLHIIRLTGVRPEKVKPLAEVKAEIQAELQREQAARKFAEAAESFGNTVYEQADSLQPAAEKWKLGILRSDWLSKGGKLPAPFGSPKFAEVLFSEDAIKHRRNTEAIEVGPGTLVAARVVEHHPASLQALDSVKEAIRKQLLVTEAGKLAQRDGEESLARLTKGESPKLAWSTSRSVVRAAPTGLSPDAAQAIFKVDARKLPAFAGASLPGGGYALYRVTAVKPASGKEPAAVELMQQYSRVVAEEEFTAWVGTLRQRFPVEINAAALEKK